MIKNVGNMDRIIRGVAGLIVLLIALFSVSGIWQAVLMVIGAVLVFTALTGVCLLYSILGISTCKIKSE